MLACNYDVIERHFSLLPDFSVPFRILAIKSNSKNPGFHRHFSRLLVRPQASAPTFPNELLRPELTFPRSLQKPRRSP
jgi:hypothetical protein